MNTTTLSTPLMVEVLEDLRIHNILECKFERRMREVQKEMNWNARGILSPYATELDYTHFATAENGVIQGGGSVSYEILKQNMRALWKTIPITGDLERYKSEQFINIKEEYGAEIPIDIQLTMAENRAVELILRQAAMVYGRLKNFYAINGVDSSAMGTVTGAPSATTVEFSWATTDNGNRFIKNGQKIQWYDTSASTLRRLAAHYASPRNESEQYSVVTGHVDERASVNVANNGLVTFDVLPSVSLAAGDTAHIIQGYGAMPQGFFHWVNDTGNLNTKTGTIARSAFPEVFVSTIQNNSSSTANTPALMVQMESMIRGRVSDNSPIATEIWMNKAQVYKYQLFALNSSVAGGAAFNVARFGDYTAPSKIDVGVPFAGNSFNNLRIEEDVDIPPSKNIWIDWLGWVIDIQTPETVYNYHQNQEMYQALNTYGEVLDAKRITFFSQYNYRLTRFGTQGFQDDLAFDANQIAMA